MARGIGGGSPRATTAVQDRRREILVSLKGTTKVMKTQPTVKQMHWLRRWEDRYIRALQNRYALTWRPLTRLTLNKTADVTAGLNDGDATGSKSKFSICFHRRNRIAAENLTTLFGGLITLRHVERACDLVFDQGSSRSCRRKLDGRLRCPDVVKQLRVGGKPF